MEVITIYNRALHILTAFDTENELVLGQLPVDEKTMEQIIAKDELYRKTVEKAHNSIETREYFMI